MSVRSQVLKALCVRLKAMNEESSVPLLPCPWTIKENKCESGSKSSVKAMEERPQISQDLVKPLKKEEPLQKPLIKIKTQQVQKVVPEKVLPAKVICEKVVPAKVICEKVVPVKIVPVKVESSRALRSSHPQKNLQMELR